MYLHVHVHVHMHVHVQYSHVIEDGENDTKQHLYYAQDDSHLHLVGIGEDQLVVSNTPNLEEEFIII